MSRDSIFWHQAKALVYPYTNDYEDWGRQKEAGIKQISDIFFACGKYKNQGFQTYSDTDDGEETCQVELSACSQLGFYLIIKSIMTL